MLPNLSKSIHVMHLYFTHFANFQSYSKPSNNPARRRQLQLSYTNLDAYFIIYTPKNFLERNISSKGNVLFIHKCFLVIFFQVCSSKIIAQVNIHTWFDTHKFNSNVILDYLTVIHCSNQLFTFSIITVLKIFYQHQNKIS